MKKIISILISIICINPAYNAEGAKLKISLAHFSNDSYICLSNLHGCVNISKAENKILTMDTGLIENAMIIHPLLHTADPLPISCLVNLQPRETLVLTERKNVLICMTK